MAKEHNGCEWKHSAGLSSEDTWDDSNVWFTVCDNAFEFNDGGPKENHFKFCPYCGKPIVEQALNSQKKG